MIKLPHIITHHFSIGFKENRFEVILTRSFEKAHIHKGNMVILETSFFKLKFYFYFK
jgi:hypothetical protein